MSILCDFYAENGGMLVGYEDAGVNEWQLSVCRFALKYEKEKKRLHI